MFRKFLVAAALLLALASGPVAAQSGLDGALQCPCDCGKFLTVCGCDTAASAKGFVQGLEDTGRDDGQIAEEYGKKYGEQYVNYVPKSGRGLSLWMAAPIGVVVGAGAIYYRLQGTGEGATRPGGSGGVSCPDCGAELSRDAKFCTGCGAERGITCGSCGVRSAGGDAFCTGCGEPLDAACPSCGEPPGPGASFCPGCGESL